MKIIIKGQELYLRSITLRDANKVYLGWLNNKKVNKVLETRHNKQTLKEIKKYILNFKKEKSTLLAICLNESNKHIGNIKIGAVNENHKYAYISYFIGDTDEWGKGYGTEAVKLTLKISFNILNLYKCYAGIYKKNIASAKVLKNSGFKKEAILKSSLIYLGKRDDHIIYSVLKKDFLKLKKRKI